MRLYVLLPVVTLSVVGCNAGVIDDRADQEIEMVHWRANRDAIAPSCADGSAYGPSCGLLSDYTASADFQTKFAQKRCTALEADACGALLARSRDEWLRDRYFAADLVAVERQCEARAGLCEDPKAHELLLLQSHDAMVSSGAAREENEINEERAAEHAADTQATLDLISRLADVAATASAAGSDDHREHREHRRVSSSNHPREHDHANKR